jgi:hypothetical protein
VDAATAFIAAKGWTLDESQICKDENKSGMLFANRGECQPMMHDASAGAIDVVVFFDVDPIAETDDAVLSTIEGEVLGTRFIRELLALVDTAPDETAWLVAERDRLQTQVDRLVMSIASGVPGDVGGSTTVGSRCGKVIGGVLLAAWRA